MRGDRAATVGRLKKRPDFVAAASGRRFHTERMTVQGRPRDDRDDGLRIGLTVTRRVGHATERNRIKRRLRTVFQTVGAEHASANVDIVIIARRDSLTVGYDVLLDDLARALRTVTKPGTKPGSPRRPGRGSAPATPSHSANRVQT